MFATSLRTLVASLTLLLGLAAPAFAHSVGAGDLELTDLWTRATPPNAPTAGGYLTIENKGSEADRLIGVSSPVAGRAEIHEMSVTDGTMTMRPVEGGIEIAPDDKISLAPGGFHLMFMDMKQPLKEGEKMPVVLTFEKAGKVETFLHVLSIGADGPGDRSGHTSSQGTGGGHEGHAP